ncbi:MAG: IS1595 family transposase [Chloroflexi bacterium]|nr:IS1595 family transposase [Chloroflexota bacterium]
MFGKTTGPGQSYRKGITFLDAARIFSDEDSAQEWIISKRWSRGITCPSCGNQNVSELKRRGTLRRWRCKDRKACGKNFTVKTDTIMHDSKLPVSQWCIAIYLYTTNLKGISAMKLHRELGIAYKNAWHMAHRIRKAMETQPQMFQGPVEVDETYIGGKVANMSNAKRRQLKEEGFGRGPSGKTAAVGMKDRDTGMVVAEVPGSTDKNALQGFIAVNTEVESVVYTDEHGSYRGLPRPHQAVKHSVKEYVDGQAHTNGIESFWANLKRGYVGTYHWMSAKHLHRYVSEFEGRHNVRPLDTEDQMTAVVLGAERKRTT